MTGNSKKKIVSPLRCMFQILVHFPMEFQPHFLRPMSTASWWINCVVSLVKKSPQSLPKRVIHWVPYSASSFKFQYLLFSIRLSSSCLFFFPVFPTLSSFIRQFLCKVCRVSKYRNVVQESYLPQT
jgi:hypothetical protein